MDVQLPTSDTKVGEASRCHQDLRKEEAVKQDQQPLLAAYRDNALCSEAAEQLARMLEDGTTPTHAGEDLPKADRAALLRKARQPQVAS
jgi:hypothetical protein